MNCKIQAHYNILRWRPNGRHFGDDIFKCIFLRESLDFFFKFHWSLFLRFELTIFQHCSDNGPAPTRRHSLCEPMMVSLLAHICITPQWGISKLHSHKVMLCNYPSMLQRQRRIPDSKVHGANMGPTWVLSAPDGPHVGPMNLAMRDKLNRRIDEWLLIDS